MDQKKLNTRRQDMLKLKAQVMRPTYREVALKQFVDVIHTEVSKYLKHHHAHLSQATINFSHWGARLYTVHRLCCEVCARGRVNHPTRYSRI